MTDESLFAAALALPAADRHAYLAANCPDPVARKQVEELLAAADASNLLDAPPADVEQTIPRAQTPPEPSASVGDRIGPYKLLEKIGEGGMGEVWVADQQEPIKRRVALKLIKPGMDSRSVLGRFEAERQALAVMNHDNIARVFEAGTTADGRPYFVMELVKGTPITEFADARKLTPKQRLELFVPVCQAIQHAHMKGIIHRDIKPGNVLVALHDETPVPKVIDFGVAKAVGQQLTEKTIYTGFGALVGTPTYMAPEQATFNQLDVDTRADVYALGVLLYELLAGSPPIEKDRLKKAALDEVLRIVRDEEPPRPSQRLSTSQAKATIAATRGSEPAKLSALMKGELDWIVMKALEKDRTRRYETANGFAADVQRFLAGEPVQAVPPSMGYRVKKFVRKHKARVATVILLATTVGVGIVGTTWQAAERLHERETGRLRATQTAQSAVDRAEAALLAGRLPEVDASLAAATAYAPNDDAELGGRINSIRRDREAVAELDAIYEQYWTVCPYRTRRDPEIAKARYPKVLREYGIAVGELTTDELTDRVGRARIAPALTDALVTWFFLAPHADGLAPLLDHLDGDGYRRAVRRAVAVDDAIRLKELAKQPEALGQPPVFAVMLAAAVPDPDNGRILTATWSRHPDSFPVALALTFPAANTDGAHRLGWCRTAVALRPANALAHYYLSLALNQAKDQTGRLEAVRRATELAPRFAAAHAELGHALNDLNRTDEALAAFRRAVDIDPGNWSANAGLTIVHMDRKDWVAASQTWRRTEMLEDRPDLPPEEGCHSAAVVGGLWAYRELFALTLAAELLRLERYNELVGLCADLDKGNNGHFGRTSDILGVIEKSDGEHLDIRKNFPACAAVQAAAGRGVDPPPPAERSQVRRLALEWLSADLKACEAKWAADPKELRAKAHAAMNGWLADPLLADVRGDRITALPSDEQRGWERLWADVSALHAKTAPERRK